MNRKRIVFLGFDHGKDDRRIAKDINLLKARFHITYFYRADEFETSTSKDGVNYVGLKVDNNYPRLVRRFKYENEMTKRAVDIGAHFFYLHGMFITFPGFFLRKLKRFGDIIYDAHEYDLEPVYIKSPIFRQTLSYFLLFRQKRISGLIKSSFSVSPSILRFMQKCHFNNVHLKMNVSDTKVLKPLALQKREPVLVIAGNISRERGVNQFLEIFKQMKDKGASLSLHIHSRIDDPELEVHLKKWVDKNLPNGSVIFGGFLPYTRLKEKLSQSIAGVMAFPSDGSITNRIALPNRFFDSLASGTPILASRDSVDVAEYVESQNIGWLFDPDDPSQDISFFLHEITSHSKYSDKLKNVYRFAEENDVKSVKRALKLAF